MGNDTKVKFSNRPYVPEGAEVMNEYKMLADMRDAMTNSYIDKNIESQINSLLKRWTDAPKSVEPIAEMQSILEGIRRISVGETRVKMMNTVVRTLGQPEALATYLDMLQDSAKRAGSKEYEYCKNKLQQVKLHSIYGWCGNTLMVETSSEPTEGTFPPLPGLAEKLGNSSSAWNLTVHIWQPNLTAKGFSINTSLPNGTILEPPHTHPFDFSSMVVKGTLHQSIYIQNEENTNQVYKEDYESHYRNIPLEHVDGVWPPHEFKDTQNITTKEHRVRLNQGDSYYMPCDWIHDVEIDGHIASTKPTITLFLSSEYLVMPHVYMSQQMADYHHENPDIKKNGQPISEKAWHEKLSAISSYLKGESENLDLNKIVDFKGEYAFFHR